MSSTSGKVTVKGVVYRPQPRDPFEAVFVEIEIEGAGQVVESDAGRVPLSESGEVALLTLVLEKLNQNSRIGFRFPGFSDEPFSFLAAFFDDQCMDDEKKQVTAPTPAGKGTRSAYLPTATPIVVTRGPASTNARPLPTQPASTGTQRQPTQSLQGSKSIPRVKAEILNVRAGPGTNYSKVTQVREGEQVVIQGRNQTGDWLKITTPKGHNGWVAAKYIESAPPGHDIPVLVTPQAACSRSTGSRFQGIWDATQKRTSASSRLGCPLNDAHPVYGAAQVFQNGYMLWREDNKRIYVLYDNKSAASYPDEFRDGRDPENAGYSAPPGLKEPKRGFGKVWRERLGGQSASIGWAKSNERVASNLVVQDFENGIIFWEDKVGNRVVLNTGSWEQW